MHSILPSGSRLSKFHLVRKVNSSSIMFNLILPSPNQEPGEKINGCLVIRPLANLRFCRLSGSFEPIFDSFLGIISTFVYYPPKKNQKAAKIIPKIDEPLVMQEVYSIACQEETLMSSL